ncbi:hypothetical protein Tco_0505198 [Tanacetum coccineum]
MHSANHEIKLKCRCKRKGRYGTALVAGLVVTESSGTKSDKQDTSSRSGNDIDADDADIKPVYDEERMAEVQLTADKNVFATGQQHTEKPKFNNKGQKPIDVIQRIALSLNAQRIQTIIDLQVDVKNDLSKPVTPYYLPKIRESAFVKSNHVIASISYRNSSNSISTLTLKETYGSNDMIHNYYLEDARKKTQESGRNSRPSVMPSARSQSITSGSKPKPRINNQKYRNWPASKSSCVTTKTVPIAEHSTNSRNFY